MTVERLPHRKACVWLIRAAAGDYWLVLAGSHAWAFGQYEDAREDAEWLAQNLALPIRGGM